jgi:drug/metabolite transporter (DMT)-like permease
MSATLVLSFAVMTFGFMYLATNTSQEHVHLQILNYLLSYVFVAFTGYSAYAVSVPETEASLTGLLTGFNDGFSFVLYLVFAYFGIFLLRKVLETMKVK